MSCVTSQRFDHKNMRAAAAVEVVRTASWLTAVALFFFVLLKARFEY